MQVLYGGFATGCVRPSPTKDVFFGGRAWYSQTRLPGAIWVSNKGTAPAGDTPWSMILFSHWYSSR